MSWDGENQKAIIGQQPVEVAEGLAVIVEMLNDVEGADDFESASKRGGMDVAANQQSV